MALPLSRSESVNQISQPAANPSISRSVSFSQSFGSIAQNSHTSSTNTRKKTKLSYVKDCLADANAQDYAFIKEYPQYWDLVNTTVLIRYNDAEISLPDLASQLNDCKLESLLLVKNTLRNMKEHLAGSLTSSAEKDGQLSSHLEHAEHATGNAILLLCSDGTSDFRFDKSKQKDLHSSNDIMSAAIIINRYFTDMINNIQTTAQVNVSL